MLVGYNLERGRAELELLLGAVEQEVVILQPIASQNGKGMGREDSLQ